MQIFNKYFCKFFGHKLDEHCYYNHSVLYCLRCFDSRAPHLDGSEYWTDQEYYGLIGYPIWRLKTYILSKWIWVKLKTGKLKVGKIEKEDIDKDDCPF